MAKRWIEEHIRNGRLLDIGCFDGRFLELMDGSWTRFGIEINVRAARRAEQQRSVEVIGHEVEKLAEVGKPFDVITAFDVIEHVADPLHMLRLAAESVRPGGAIVVATGNTQAPSWQLMKNQYWYCSIPEHLSFIGEDWARWAAERLGLEVVFLERYSHDAERIWTRTIRQALLSLLLKSAPRAFGALRAAGLSEINIDDRDELKTYPPLWSAAFDHFLVIFRR